MRCAAIDTQQQGISLSLEQYKALLRVIPQLNEELRSQGHDVGGLPATGTSDALVKADRPKAKKSQKANIDVTSEEEVDDDDE
jgi:hypothetical protein